MPIVGIASVSVIRAATCAGTASSTRAQQPARSRAGGAAGEEVGPGGGGEARGGGVVRRHHDALLTAALELRELGQRQLAGGGRVRRGRARAGGHAASPSRGTLSIRRVRPTRAAA